MSYEEILNSLNNRVTALSDEIKQLRTDNSRMKEEIRLLRADVVLRHPQEYSKKIENPAARWYIGEQNIIAGEDIIDYYNDKFATVGNDLDNGESTKTK